MISDICTKVYRLQKGIEQWQVCRWINEMVGFGLMVS